MKKIVFITALGMGIFTVLGLGIASEKTSYKTIFTTLEEEMDDVWFVFAITKKNIEKQYAHFTMLNNNIPGSGLKEQVDAGNKTISVDIIGDGLSNNENITSIVYRVQIATSQTRLPLNAEIFKNCGTVYEYYHNGQFKYTTGKFSNHEDAEELSLILNNKGYSNAFPLAFVNHTRMSILDARHLTGEL